MSASDNPAINRLQHLLRESLEETYFFAIDTLLCVDASNLVLEQLGLTADALEGLSLTDIVVLPRGNDLERALRPLRERRASNAVIPGKVRRGCEDAIAAELHFSIDLTAQPAELLLHVRAVVPPPVRLREESPDETVLAAVNAPGNEALWTLVAGQEAVQCSAQLQQVLGIRSQDGNIPLAAFETQIHPRDRRRVIQARNRVLRGEQQTYTLEYALSVADMDRQVIEHGQGQLTDGPMRLIATVRDRSAPASAQSALAHDTGMEKMARFAGKISHDFNNLLGVVMGNLDLMRRSTEESKMQRRIDSALQAAVRGSDLTQRLQEFANREPTNGSACDVNGVISELGCSLDDGDDRVAMRISLAPGLWPVVAETTGLETALLNVIANARTGLSEAGGSIEVQTRNLPAGTALTASSHTLFQQDAVVITVSDDGVGMSPDKAALAMEPHYSTVSGLGAGLGLATVQSFMTRFHGILVIDSRPTIGTTVQLIFPRAAGANRTRPAASVSASPGHLNASHVNHVHAGDETILLVDDEPSLTSLASQLLASHGYKVYTLSSADQAVAMLRREKIDLIFSDVMMPGHMNGFQLASHVKAHYPNCPVLLTSGYTAKSESGDSAEFYVIPKPYQLNELLVRVRAALDEARAP